MGDVVVMPQHAVSTARDYSGAQLDLIRRTVAADCSANEFDLFIEVAKRVGLDPFRKQIYAVVYNKKDDDKRKMSIITGIDGYRAVAARSGQYRPDDQPPVIEYDDAAKDKDLNPLGIVRATVVVYKFGPDREWHASPGVAYWDEFAPLKEEWAPGADGKRRPTGRMTLDKTSNWFRMGRIMIAKCAEAAALRRGWPEDLSGTYIAEEMDQAQAVDLTASAAADAHRTEHQQRLIGSANSVFIAWRAGEAIEPTPLGQMHDRCAAFFREAQSVTELTAWRDRNRHALQDFWARAKSDALSVRQLLEARIEDLSQD